MKRVFICSPYRGDVEANTQTAIDLCRMAFNEGLAPFAPHLLYPQILDDSKPEERDRAIEAGLGFIRSCEMMWVHGLPTRGMELEIEEAQRLGLYITQIRHITKRDAA